MPKARDESCALSAFDCMTPTECATACSPNCCGERPFELTKSVYTTRMASRSFIELAKRHHFTAVPSKTWSVVLVMLLSMFSSNRAIASSNSSNICE